MSDWEANLGTKRERQIDISATASAPQASSNAIGELPQRPNAQVSAKVTLPMAAQGTPVIHHDRATPEPPSHRKRAKTPSAPKSQPAILLANPAMPTDPKPNGVASAFTPEKAGAQPSGIARSALPSAASQMPAVSIQVNRAPNSDAQKNAYIGFGFVEEKHGISSRKAEKSGQTTKPAQTVTVPTPSSASRPPAVSKPTIVPAPSTARSSLTMPNKTISEPVQVHLSDLPPSPITSQSHRNRLDDIQCGLATARHRILKAKRKVKRLKKKKLEAKLLLRESKALEA